MSDETINAIVNANADLFAKTGGALEEGTVIILPAKGLIAPTAGQQQAAGAYLVKLGDSLAQIAQTYYGDFGAWEKIYEANKDRVKLYGDSPMIYEGQWLVIPE